MTNSQQPIDIEEKRITLELVDSDEHPITKHREWMLGGETMQWAYFKDPVTNELVLQRW